MRKRHPASIGARALSVLLSLGGSATTPQLLDAIGVNPNRSSELKGKLLGYAFVGLIHENKGEGPRGASTWVSRIKRIGADERDLIVGLQLDLERKQYRIELIVAENNRLRGIS
jgi:hypothetical protein